MGTKSSESPMLQSSVTKTIKIHELKLLFKPQVIQLTCQYNLSLVSTNYETALKAHMWHLDSMF